MHPLLALATITASTLAALLPAAGVLHLLGRLGPTGRTLSEWFCRGLGLDLVIAWFTALPMISAAVTGSILLAPTWGVWTGIALGLLAAIAGQVLTVCAWTVLHELAHREAVKGPRIVTALNKHVGPLRNHTAVWWTALAVPIFFIVRVGEYIVYPPLTWLVRLPRYKSSEWVNVSRHKVRGLVGHDLIWCLYCDWMTGVWSLGSEMLRNVESFWCPIRFDTSKKCENCRVDFPDIDNGWIAADGDVAQAAALVGEKYSKHGPNAWFGHPVRLTIKGEQK